MAVLKIKEMITGQQFPKRRINFSDIADPEMLKPSPMQRTLDLSHAESLEPSIALWGGLVDPIEVEIWPLVTGGFQFYIPHGQHRWTACCKLLSHGVKVKIPCTVEFVPEGGARTIENAVTNSNDLRKRENVLDRYITYTQVLAELKRKASPAMDLDFDVMHGQVATLLNVDVRTVQRVLKIGKLPESLRYAIREEIRTLKDTQVYSISDSYVREIKSAETKIKAEIKGEWLKTIKDTEDATPKEKRRLKAALEDAVARIEVAKEQVLLDVIEVVKRGTVRSETSKPSEQQNQLVPGGPSADWIKEFKKRLKELPELNQKQVNKVLEQMV